MVAAWESQLDMNGIRWARREARGSSAGSSSSRQTCSCVMASRPTHLRSLCEYFSHFGVVAGCFLALSQGVFLAMLQPFKRLRLPLKNSSKQRASLTRVTHGSSGTPRPSTSHLPHVALSTYSAVHRHATAAGSRDIYLRCNTPKPNRIDAPTLQSNLQQVCGLSIGRRLVAGTVRTAPSSGATHSFHKA